MLEPTGGALSTSEDELLYTSSMLFVLEDGLKMTIPRETPERVLDIFLEVKYIEERLATSEILPVTVGKVLGPWGLLPH